MVQCEDQSVDSRTYLKAGQALPAILALGRQRLMIQYNLAG